MASHLHMLKEDELRERNSRIMQLWENQNLTITQLSLRFCLTKAQIIRILSQEN